MPASNGVVRNIHLVPFKDSGLVYNAEQGDALLHRDASFVLQQAQLSEKTASTIARRNGSLL